MWAVPLKPGWVPILTQIEVPLSGSVFIPSILTYRLPSLRVQFLLIKVSVCDDSIGYSSFHYFRWLLDSFPRLLSSNFRLCKNTSVTWTHWTSSKAIWVSSSSQFCLFCVLGKLGHMDLGIYCARKMQTLVILRLYNVRRCSKWNSWCLEKFTSSGYNPCVTRYKCENVQNGEDPRMGWSRCGGPQRWGRQGAAEQRFWTFEPLWRVSSQESWNEDSQA